MSSTTDRLADGYQPDFDVDYEAGAQGELFVTRIIDSLKSERAEIKTDYVAAETGNVYLEIQCLRRGEWRWSGIATTKAEVWCHLVSTGVCIAAPTERVREIARHYWGLGGRWTKELTAGSHPTKAVVMPVQLFVSLLANGIPGGA